MERVAVIFLCFALLKLKCFALDVTTVGFSTYLKMADRPDTLTTLSVLSFTDCWTLCDDVTSCVAINYRARGHICELNHYVRPSQYGFSMSSEAKAGYVSRKRYSFWTEHGTTQCPNCGSCIDRDVLSEGCKAFACRSPPKYGTLNRWGNMNTFGGKYVYGCYNHETEKKRPQFIKCSNGGEWEGLEPICDYGDYQLNENTPLVNLKMVNKKVKKSEAEQRCGYEGAKLPTLLTKEKLELIRSIAENLPGDFWIDAVRIDGEDKNWQTSNGTQYDVEDGVWKEWGVTTNGQDDDCARSEEKSNWRINDAKCYDKFAYICEMP